jgi:RNA polymerase sigma factor (sigma-70 family)
MAIETLGAALRRINHLFADGVVTGLSDAHLLERFAAGQDASAFEVLVARHGPMVLSVCRGILKDPNDAEDAFQATFLILVKKSGTIRGRVALGPWLYRVAYRVALRANAASARRRECERRAGQMAAANCTTGPAGPDETLQTLHEEIARLPEKLRRAVLLCDLQRLPRARAADELRLSESTVQRRLNEGRQRLKARMIRRGLAHEGGLMGAVFLREAQSAVPAAWSQAAVGAAMAVANHTTTAGAVSAAAKGLAQEVLTTMLRQKITIVSTALLAAGLIAWGASATFISPGEEPAKKAAASRDPSSRRNPATPALAPGPDPIAQGAVRGRVLGPDGRPVPGAKLYVTPATGYLMKPYPAPECATTGADGRFAFTPPEPKYPGQTTRVTAAATGYGPGWVNVAPDDTRDDLTLRLVPDDVPITGRIIGLEGKPVPGASVQVLQINSAPDEGLDRWLAAARAGKGLTLQLEHEYLGRETIAPSPTVTTDAEGRFRLTGIGRNRLVLAQLDGPTIVSEYLHILTRPGESVVVTEHEGDRQYGEPRITTTYHGAAFEHAAAPCKPIVGVVRDPDTKKPMGGVMIRSYTLATRPNHMRDIVRTTTDAEGRFRLTGMPRGRGNRIMAVPGGDRPYPARSLDVPDSPGLDPVTVDIELRRGLWIEGRITDKVTGQPVRSSVEFLSMYTNPNLRDYPGYHGAGSLMEGVFTKADGSFRVVGVPGPGIIGVHRNGHYLTSDEREDEYGVEQRSVNTAPYAITHPVNYSALARIDPPKGADSVTRDVTLDPGWTITGVVLGPDGQPLAGAFGMGIGQMKTAEFTMRGFAPRASRELVFRHAAKGLIGLAPPPKADGSSINVTLRPGATVMGRLVDADGRPEADRALEMRFRPKEGPTRAGRRVEYGCGPIRTDREGRFRIEALPPGYEFELLGGKGGSRIVVGDGLNWGQTKDLGDVRMKGQER